MASAAAPAENRFHFSQNMLKFGESQVPIDRVNYFDIDAYEFHYPDVNGRPENTVSVWAARGQKTIRLDFQCQTRDKLASFVKELLRVASPSFHLWASAVRPSIPLRKPGQDHFLETVQIEFKDERYAAEFHEMIAPHFFPGFRSLLEGRVLNLSIEGAKERVLQAAKTALTALDAKTFGRTNELVWSAQNPLFPGTFPRPEYGGPDRDLHDERYVVSAAGVKEHVFRA